MSTEGISDLRFASVKPSSIRQTKVELTKDKIEARTGKNVTIAIIIQRAILEG